MTRKHEILRTIPGVLLTLLLIAPAGATAATVEVRRMLDTSSIGNPFVFDVDPAGAILVLTRDNIYDAGANEFLFGEQLRNPGWLAFSGGKLQFLANGALFILDKGTPRKLLDVPLKGRIFASDGEQTYISGITAAGKPVLFLYKAGVGYKALLELDAPIDAMALAKGALFFSAGQKIYTLREGGPARLFAHLPGFSSIASLAVDERSGVLYFSDGGDLYAVYGNSFVVVRRGFGGMLRCREGDLYVLSWHKHALFRLRGLSETLSSPKSLVPLKDPCKDPDLVLYCRAEEGRALLKALVELDGATGSGDAAVRAELADYMGEQKAELVRVTVGLEKEAAAGTLGMRWGGGLEPQGVGANTVITTAAKGIGIALWDGSEVRVGPESKVIIGDCRQSRDCRLTLEKGLLYFQGYKPPVAGMDHPSLRKFSIITEALNLNFDSGELALYASGDHTAVVVLEGRIKTVTPKDESVIITANETLEVQSGEPPGIPGPANMARLRRWWEDIR